MRTGSMGLGAMLMVLASTVGAEAGNWSVISRHFYEGPTYGCHPHAGQQDCMMSWQPIRSSMHYNVLPPGMLRPPPLYRPTPWLAPPTPDFSRAGVWAAGQRTKGVPCHNDYPVVPAGCDYLGKRPWWYHLTWWKGGAKSACDCSNCSP